jgi:uncharacterized protein (DUF2344 family)
MALGVPGTGPYGAIRSLQQEIKACKYELRLIGQGMIRQIGPKRLAQMIENNKTEIKKIRLEIKKNKGGN